MFLKYITNWYIRGQWLFWESEW